MKIAIIEDEKLAADRLEELIHTIEPEAEIVARLESVARAVSWLAENRADLLFVDIQLSDGQSFAIFEQVRVEAPVILTTAYDQYAIRAFKLNSIDYLLKPIRREELAAALTKYRHLRTAYQPDLGALIKSLTKTQTIYKQRFIVQIGERIKSIESHEIAYFYALEKGVYLTTNKNQTYTIDWTLDRLQEVLDPELFFRINRKIILRYEAIRNMTAYSRARIKIDLHPPAPKSVDAVVSVERAPRFRDWIDR
ncbi:response regulator transcription factor [candidate division KSB1 bacterium]|nr:response regulator transcription factor [candidate division KSB1 bacterium]